MTLCDLIFSILFNEEGGEGGSARKKKHAQVHVAPKNYMHILSFTCTEFLCTYISKMSLITYHLNFTSLLTLLNFIDFFHPLACIWFPPIQIFANLFPNAFKINHILHLPSKASYSLLITWMKHFQNNFKWPFNMEPHSHCLIRDNELADSLVKKCALQETTCKQIINPKNKIEWLWTLFK